MNRITHHSIAAAAAIVFCAPAAFAQSTVRLSSDLYVVPVGTSEVAVTISRPIAGAAIGAVEQVFYRTQEVHGQPGQEAALDGVHYIGRSGTLTWAEDDFADKTVTVSLLNRSGITQTHSFGFALEDDQGNPVAAPSTAEIRIMGTQTQPAVVQLTADTYSVAVSQNEAVINISRRNTGTAPAAQIFYKTRDLTAADGVHYQGQTGTIDFAANDFATKQIRIPILHRDQILNTLNFQVELVDAVGEQLGATTLAQVQVLGTLDAGAGQARFASSTIRPAASATSATVDVLRSNGGQGKATVRVRTVDSQGLVNPLDQTLEFGDGQTGPLSVTITGVAPREQRQTPVVVTLELLEAQGFELGQPNTVDVVFAEREADAAADHTSSTGFEVLSRTVGAGATQAVGIVNRTSASDQPLRINYVIRDVSSQAGVDYPVGDASGVIEYAAGETGFKQIVVNLSNPNRTSSRQFVIELSSTSDELDASRAEQTVTLQATSPDQPGQVGSIRVESQGVVLRNPDVTSVTIPVSRSGPSDSLPATVNFTASGSAEPGTDYDASTASGTLSWSAGDNSLKLVTVALLNPSEPRPTRDLVISFSGTGVVPGANRFTATLPPIVADQPAGTGVIRFDDVAVRVPHDVSEVNLVVARAGTKPLAPATVSLRTIDGDKAIGGRDFQSTVEQLSWGQDETGLRQIAIPILRTSDQPRTFTVKMTGDGVNAEQSTLTVVLAAAPAEPVPTAGSARFAPSQVTIPATVTRFPITVLRTSGQGVLEVLAVPQTLGIQNPAQQGVDYDIDLSSRTLRWEAGDQSPREIMITRPALSAGDSSFTLKLVKVNGDNLPGVDPVLVTIQGTRHVPPADTIGFVEAQGSVGIHAPGQTYPLVLRRQGDQPGSVSVTISGSDGSEYRVVWSNGDYADKTVVVRLPDPAFERNGSIVYTINLLNDDARTSQSVFELKIKNGGGGAMGLWLMPLVALFGLRRRKR
ncbi:Calx-beta domain-containing protein [Sinimarinibacterium sp. NLF-5-8]|uniref:Calx-beta domain-containing protein n=1 Tax=Sinimarinibacterium sp. NLF-5-8 TaxID=2698684 RepID=UPI00137BB53D|nr:Calx-beta domain-containing protein [Sinimarinibacterium sp. NLF-5-8]QHS09147.1 hypothetical protein GT972_02570 [Sinimarinibacterium sp. NLF-5-8]